MARVTTVREVTLASVVKDTLGRTARRRRRESQEDQEDQEVGEAVVVMSSKWEWKMKR